MLTRKCLYDILFKDRKECLYMDLNDRKRKILQAIIDEFDEKRKSAVEHGNTQLVEELNKAQAKALSSLATNVCLVSLPFLCPSAISLPLEYTFRTVYENS